MDILTTEWGIDSNGFYVLKNLKKNNKECAFHSLFFLKENKTYVVDKLDILYIYILKFLADNEIKPNIVLKNGNCANLTAKIGDFELVFINWRNKFGFDFLPDFDRNLKVVQYAEQHHHDRKSIGADAYNAFLHSFFGKNRDDAELYNVIKSEKFHPIFEYDDMLLECKRNVQGVQFCRPGRYSNLIEYDISGSYPASALNDLPEGKPYYFDSIDKVPKSYFKIIQFTYYDAKLKPNGIDFIGVGTIGRLTLSERLFGEFCRNYDAKIKIKRIEAFKTHKSMLKSFINETVVRGKQLEADEDIAKYNKTLGNAIIGYFGRNTTTTTCDVKIEPTGLEIESHEQTIEPVYLPAYLAILDTSKAKFLRAIKPYYNKIVYANTDGFLTSEHIDLAQLNMHNSNAVLGNFKVKHTFKDIYIHCLNGYAGVTTDGEVVNTISGMTLTDAVTPDAYEQQSFSYTVNLPTADGRMRQQVVDHV